jgi:hypothetical protein
MGKTAATWEDVFGKADKPVADIAAALRTLIFRIRPETVECAYPGYNGVSYGFVDKKNSQGYLYLMTCQTRLNLGFYQGIALPDPAGLLEGDGKALRHVKVNGLAMAANPALDSLIRAAVAERRQALGLS